MKKSPLIAPDLILPPQPAQGSAYGSEQKSRGQPAGSAGSYIPDIDQLLTIWEAQADQWLEMYAPDCVGLERFTLRNTFVLMQRQAHVMKGSASNTEALAAGREFQGNAEAALRAADRRERISDRTEGAGYTSKGARSKSHAGQKGNRTRPPDESGVSSARAGGDRPEAPAEPVEQAREASRAMVDPSVGVPHRKRRRR